jgi:hypothetical protein
LVTAAEHPFVLSLGRSPEKHKATSAEHAFKQPFADFFLGSRLFAQLIYKRQSFKNCDVFPKAIRATR